MNANTELTAFWAPFLLLHLGGPDSITDYALEDNELWLWHKANVIVTFAFGIITNNVSDIYEEESGSMNANTELTAFWAPFLLLHLGGPDIITAYALEDNELWLRHFLGLAVQTGMAIYIFIMTWTGSHLSILYLLMFVAGLIKYGELGCSGKQFKRMENKMRLFFFKYEETMEGMESESDDIIATFSLGIITNNVSDIYDEKGGSMTANIELTAFWAPFLLLHLGGPDTITAYGLEDNELWLRHFLGLVVQTGMAIYVFIMAWTGSHLSILYLLMFFAGLIKYGERTWVLRKASIETRKASIETIRESLSDDGINFSDFHQSAYGHYDTLFVTYRLVCVYFRPRLPNVEVPSRSASIIASTSSEKLFKIIEMVLGFMYDNLYTKAPLLYTRCGLALRVITFFLTSSVFLLFPVVIHDKHKFSNTDVTVTYMLLVGAIILELYSAVLILSSDRFLVWLIKHENFSTKKALEPFLTQKRWSNNMSQFSLLSFIIKEKPLPCPNILKHLRLDKRLEKQWYAADMEIPNNLKTLIGL
ncbi:hypothetical protein Q3G72_009082 [Acer saccharum]|nr:hypothetical protein Q3G72_009082 [Acer saccharum]